MTFTTFVQSVQSDTPPAGISPLLEAMWYDAKGDWEGAHEIVQDLASADAAWIHAYLHRKEGDASNAGYWYRRAGRPVASSSLNDEWAQICRALIDA